MKDFYDMMKETERKACFTKKKHIKRYMKFIEQFAENPSMELSMICQACANVLHEKYGMEWGEIEDIELAVY